MVLIVLFYFATTMEHKFMCEMHGMFMSPFQRETCKKWRQGSSDKNQQYQLPSVYITAQINGTILIEQEFFNNTNKKVQSQHAILDPQELSTGQKLRLKFSS